MGNKKIITRRRKGKIGTSISEYTKINVLKLRIDDDSEYHITFEMNGSVYSENDINDWEIHLKNKNGDSWYRRNGRPEFMINYPINKIDYFED